jgi:hypothetical protein
MRVQLAKKLKNRSKAIRRAVFRYNEAALALSPPRRTVNWEEISHFSFLQDFSLLRIMDPTLLEKPWATAPTRHAMRQHQRIIRAKEEITRCNVESRRLHTSILDEARDLHHRMKLLKSSGEAPELISAVSDFIAHRKLLNTHNLQKIGALLSHPGFTGHTKAGIRKGSAVEADGRDDDILASMNVATEEDSDGEAISEDNISQEMDAVIEYISNVTIL